MGLISAINMGAFAVNGFLIPPNSVSGKCRIDDPQFYQPSVFERMALNNILELSGQYSDLLRVQLGILAQNFEFQKTGTQIKILSGLKKIALNGIDLRATLREIVRTVPDYHFQEEPLADAFKNLFIQTKMKEAAGFLLPKLKSACESNYVAAQRNLLDILRGLQQAGLVDKDVLCEWRDLQITGFRKLLDEFLR